MLKQLQLVSTIEPKTQESPYSHRLRTKRFAKSDKMGKLGFVAAILSSVTFTLTLLVLIAGVNKHILPGFYFFKVAFFLLLSQSKTDFVNRQMLVVLPYQVPCQVLSG